MLSMFNQPWINKTTQIKERSRQQKAFQAMEKFLLFYASQFQLISIPLIFDKISFDEISSATKIIMGVQQKILNVLVKQYSAKSLLNYFNLPEEILPFIDWQELMTGENMIARFDIVPADNQYQFCEINAESCIGGLKLRDCIKQYMSALKVDYPLDLSPRQVIADFLNQKAIEKNIEYIVIFSLNNIFMKVQGLFLLCMKQFAKTF